MRLITLAATVVLTASGSASAQNLDALTQALDHLPQTILSHPGAIQAAFVDMNALRGLPELVDGAAPPQQYLRTELVAELRPIAALRMGGAERWAEHAMIELDGVSYFIGFGVSPDAVTLWGLADDAAANGLTEALLTRDFTPLADAIVGNGAPMTMDFSKADPADPWRSAMGAASFAAVRGNSVIEMADPAALDVFTKGEPSVAQNPVVATALKGLEQSVGDGWIVEAVLISPAFGLTAHDPAAFLVPKNGNFEPLRAQLEAEVQAGGVGIAPYFGGIIADVQLDTPAMAIALTYPDCDTALSAADQIGQRWVSLMPEAAQGTITTGHAEGPDGLCAALVTIKAPTADPMSNPIVSSWYGSYLSRGSNVLEIGAPA